VLRALGFKEHQLNISVKQAVLENIRGVSELFNSYRMFYKQGTDIDLASEFISERINNSESVIFFAQNQDGDYLGFTQLYPTFSSVSAKKSWVLNDLFVAENARGFGVAKQLMDAAKTLASETNANGIALETSEGNHNAQALYESLGYKKSSGVYNYFLSLTPA
jgi:GNAT superfamily N-acetyltransferase